MKPRTPSEPTKIQKGDALSLIEMARVEMARRNWSYSDLGKASGYSARTIQKEFSLGFRSKKFRQRIAEAIGLGHGSK